MYNNKSRPLILSLSNRTRLLVDCCSSSLHISLTYQLVNGFAGRLKLGKAKTIEGLNGIGVLFTNMVQRTAKQDKKVFISFFLFFFFLFGIQQFRN